MRHLPPTIPGPVGDAVNAWTALSASNVTLCYGPTPTGHNRYGNSNPPRWLPVTFCGAADRHRADHGTSRSAMQLHRANAGTMAEAAAALVMTVSAVSGCTGGGPNPSPIGSPTSRAAAWSVQLTDGWGPVRAAQLAGDVVVVQTRNGVATLDRQSGATKWHHPGISGETDRVFVTADAVILIGTTGTAPAARVLELTTGATRFTHQLTGQVDSAVMTPAGLLVADCPQSGGGCTVAGLDLRTGKTAWQQPAPGNARLSAALNTPTRVVTADRSVPDYAMPFQVPDVSTVLMTQQAAGGDITSLDATTGRVLGRTPATVAGKTNRPVTNQRYLSWDPALRDCALPVSGGDTATGSPAWTVTVGQWTEVPTEGTGQPTCQGGGWRPAVTGDRLLAMTADERPEVIDLTSGTVSWTGPAGAHLAGAVGNTGIVRTNHALGDLAAIELGSGRTVWSRHLPPQILYRVAVSADRIAYVTTATSAGSARPTGTLTVVDGQNGRAWTAAGDNQLLGLGPGWVIGGTGGQTLGDTGPAEVRLYIG
jgi:hypothetical protein